MQVKQIPFSLDHVDVINHKIEYLDLNSLKTDIYTDESVGDKAITCIVDDRVIFSCGIRRISQGVAHVWVVPSIYCDKYKMLTYKTIKNLLDKHAELFKLHRIQTSIDSEFIKWIEFLGFEKEAVLKQFKADKSDIFLYVKFYTSQ